MNILHTIMSWHINNTQNRMMRSLLGKKLCDQIPTMELLNATKMLSINQLNAQIKLMEIWKASNKEDYPLKLNKKRSGSRQNKHSSLHSGKTYYSWLQTNHAQNMHYRCNEKLEHCSHYSDFSPDFGGCKKCNKILCENFTNLNHHAFIQSIDITYL